VGAAFALCPLVAALAPADPAGPVARAGAVAAAERRLGVFSEPAVHAWVAARPGLLAAAGLFYLWVHFPATVGALVWARLERRRAFPLARDAFLATQALTVAGYLLVPTAPPRMTAAFGGTPAALHADRLAQSVQSPYAALPSGHVAFAVLVAAIVAGLARRWAVRVAALLYPGLVTAVVVGTANHLWADAVAGVVAATAGGALAVTTRTVRGRRAARSGEAPRTRRERVRSPSPHPQPAPRPSP
jgi:hypothetical protein